MEERPINNTWMCHNQGAGRYSQVLRMERSDWKWGERGAGTVTPYPGWYLGPS